MFSALHKRKFLSAGVPAGVEGSSWKSVNLSFAQVIEVSGQILRLRGVPLRSGIRLDPCLKQALYP
jgi:hypothetical protein